MQKSPQPLPLWVKDMRATQLPSLSRFGGEAGLGVADWEASTAHSRNPTGVAPGCLFDQPHQRKPSEIRAPHMVMWLRTTRNHCRNTQRSIWFLVPLAQHSGHPVTVAGSHVGLAHGPHRPQTCWVWVLPVWRSDGLLTRRASVPTGAERGFIGPAPSRCYGAR